MEDDEGNNGRYDDKMKYEDSDVDNTHDRNES